MLDQNTSNYYKADFKNTKSTHIQFCEFMESHNLFKANTKVCDMACGSGSGTNYYAQQHQEVEFIGIDYNDKVVNWGNDYLSKLQSNNLKLEHGDWYNLNPEYQNAFDGIFSIHSLCTLKKIEPSMDELVKLNPRWIALNSLFYEGPLDVLIHIRDYTRPEITDDYPDADFNIFSLDRLKDYFSKKGYSEFHFKRFEIPVNLEKPANRGRGTYTVNTEFDKRSQFSGPVFLPWYFVVAKKSD